MACRAVRQDAAGDLPGRQPDQRGGGGGRRGHHPGGARAPHLVPPRPPLDREVRPRGALPATTHVLGPARGTAGCRPGLTLCVVRLPLCPLPGSSEHSSAAQVGIIHTSYRELSRRNSGILMAGISVVFNSLLCSIHCHKVICQPHTGPCESPPLICMTWQLSHPSPMMVMVR